MNLFIISQLLAIQKWKCVDTRLFLRGFYVRKLASVKTRSGRFFAWNNDGRCFGGLDLVGKCIPVVYATVITNIFALLIPLTHSSRSGFVSFSGGRVFLQCPFYALYTRILFFSTLYALLPAIISSLYEDKFCPCMCFI